MLPILETGLLQSECAPAPLNMKAVFRIVATLTLCSSNYNLQTGAEVISVSFKKPCCEVAA